MTTTTKHRADRTRVAINGPSQLIASIPCLLGFHPENSIVLMGLSGTRGTEVAATLRLDLPADDNEKQAVETLADTLCLHQTRFVVLTVVGRHPDHPPTAQGPPHGRLVGRMVNAFANRGRLVVDAFWTPEIRVGKRWCSYRSPDTEDGVVPDENSTDLAAVCAADGQVTFGSRNDMARQLEPDDPAALDRRARLLDATIKALRPPNDPDRALENRARSVRAAIDQVRRGDLSFADEQIVRLALALSEESVRNSCLRTAFPLESSRSKYAQRLWLELVRQTPPPERAEPAILLGHAAFARGDGPLALMAFETALEADPGHELAVLFRACLQRGMHPSKLYRLSRGFDDLYRPLSLSEHAVTQDDP